jgi:hypothetical protein
MNRAQVAAKPNSLTIGVGLHSRAQVGDSQVPRQTKRHQRRAGIQEIASSAAQAASHCFAIAAVDGMHWERSIAQQLRTSASNPGNTPLSIRSSHARRGWLVTSRIQAHANTIAWLFIASTTVQGSALAQRFCDPEEQFFQEKPTPAVPRERVNGINLSSCSSGMPCLNQVRAAMGGVQPLPAAHRWVKPEPPRQPCLESVPTADKQPATPVSTPSAPSTTP